MIYSSIDLSYLSPYVKICIWILIWAIPFSIAIYFRLLIYFHRKKRIHTTPNNPILLEGLTYSFVLFLGISAYGRYYWGITFSDYLNIIALVINLFLGYLAIKFLDAFDLKKGYKAEQHKAIVDFATTLCSINFTIMVASKVEPHFYSNYYFSLSSVLYKKENLVKHNLMENKCYLDSQMLDKVKQLQIICNHPYFHDAVISQTLLDLNFKQRNPKELDPNGIFFSDKHFDEIEYKNYLENSPECYEIGNNNKSDFYNSGEVLDWLIDVCCRIENYYVLHMPEFTPYQFRRPGHYYVE